MLVVEKKMRVISVIIFRQEQRGLRLLYSPDIFLAAEVGVVDATPVSQYHRKQKPHEAGNPQKEKILKAFLTA